jgi:hypothetical protein
VCVCECEDRGGRIESTMDGIAGHEAAMSIAHSRSEVLGPSALTKKQFMTIT